MSSKDVTKFKDSHWSLDIETADSVSMWTVVTLADLPNIPCRMPLECIWLYHSLFVVLLWSSDQHMQVHSFHLCSVQITGYLNTSIECYCRMWLSQQSSINENILVWVWWKALYEMIAIFCYWIQNISKFWIVFRLKVFIIYVRE